MSQKPLIFCAIDTPDLERAKALVQAVGPVTGGIKLGLEFFNAFGPAGVEKVREACPEAALFLDLKFHDIPNTVAGAVRVISQNLAPSYLNVHASGGAAMMAAALAACHDKTKLLAVTVLTSLDNQELAKIGYDGATEGMVDRLAGLTKASGLAGIVCSAHEIALMRAAHGEDFVLMVPGIRPKGSDQGDQKRIMTPEEALQAGATHLVIGRPITDASDPAAAALAILETCLKTT